MKMKKRYAITLIEIMIVIVLIGIISSALAFNFKGMLDKGKYEKTRYQKEKIEEILYLELLSGNYSAKEVEQHWREIVKRSPLIKIEKNKDVLDGWGKEYMVQISDDGEIEVSSSGWDSHEEKHGI